MIIGVPKEIKAQENRVAITPAGVDSFAKAGHQVYIETKAGLGSGFFFSAGFFSVFFFLEDFTEDLP